MYNDTRLPISADIREIKYRIACIAVCIENSRKGKGLLRDLEQIPLIDPDYIQFRCAEWFWERQVNSYVLQVVPERFVRQDKYLIDYREAIRIERIRDSFFAALDDVLRRHLGRME